jgi:pyridoxine 5-phosphate synthase
MHEAQLKRVTAALQIAGIEVSLFIDPDAAQIAASKHIGAQVVELHTGRYCECHAKSAAQAAELARLAAGAQQAASLGLRVAAGHGLDYWNVGPIAALPEITELNIGYAIICRAVLLGLERAVRDMKELIG